MLDQPMATQETASTTVLDGVRLAQADTAAPAVLGTPAVTGPQAPTALEPTGPQDPTSLVVAPPGEGERAAVLVRPGQAVVLEDPAFDPEQAQYVPQGPNLEITLADGRVLVLLNFFAYPEAPPTLSVLQGPAVDAQTLLARAIAAQVEEVEPGAPPPGEQAVPLSEGSVLRPYDPGNLGPGLDPLGPLGPTELAYRLIDIEPDSLPTVSGGLGEGEEPGISAGPGSARLIEVSTGFPLASAREFPHKLPEGKAVKDHRINGVDNDNMRLDAPREVKVEFVNEIAAFQNTLGAYFIKPDGTIVDARIVFLRVEHADPLQLPSGDTAPRPGGGPLSPGDTVSLGVVPAGWTVGLFLAADAFHQIGQLPPGGHFEFRNAQGQPFNVLSDQGSPKLFYVVGGQAHEIQGNVFHTYDTTPHNPLTNPMNPGGLQQALSGLPGFDGDMQVAFEDLIKGQRYADQDFNDVIVKVIFSAAEVTILEERPVVRDLQINDNGVGLVSAVVLISAGLVAGDRLFLDPDQFTVNPDGTIQGTDLAVDLTSPPSQFVLFGSADASTYEAVLSAVRFGSDAADLAGIAGEREITIQVTDANGLTGTLTTGFEIVPPITGTAGDDVIDPGAAIDDLAISGRGGDDLIFGGLGDDILSGGDGDDDIFGIGGDNIIIGGPGADILVGGAGADLFVYTSLSERTDLIVNFNAGEGDAIDLSLLFADIGVNPLNVANFIEIQWLDVDQDGGANDAVLLVDLDGPGNQSDMLTLAVLANPTGLTPGVTSAQDMVDGGQIVV